MSFWKTDMGVIWHELIYALGALVVAGVVILIFIEGD
ncbi:hypothetical protein [Ralstonia phage P-PSG-11-1]|uniref:Uncharacterized protein n=1 Tax=Ralstonia phage P-PSG-11 TaxID=2652430 RepID=A0A5P8D3S6_9CAUD|nr:hypothetical protein [Ralstonia phage P-PSG-11]QFP93745.1 hypothetical protein [Ralstonia phage P-PSG-11-1]